MARLIGSVARIAALYGLLLLAGSAGPAEIQLFGDSTQVMAFPLLRERFGDAVTSQAEGGTRSGELLHSWADVEWPRQVTGSTIVINYGMNDARPWGPTSIAAYKANLRRLAEAPARVIFETPNPSTTRGVAAYAQAMREVASDLGLPVIDVHACFLRQPHWQERLTDGVHPDARGLRYIVDECVAPELHELGNAAVGTRKERG